MMRRHLLALFALFSGIAALHAPVHATTAQSAIHDARAMASAGQQAANPGCACAQRASEQPDSCPRREREALRWWEPSWLRPSVLVGSERALE